MKAKTISNITIVSSILLIVLYAILLLFNKGGELVDILALMLGVTVGVSIYYHKEYKKRYHQRVKIKEKL